MKIKLFTVPNIITLCNLVCGSMATMYAFVDNNLTLAFWLIIMAAVFDFFDGFAARLLNSYSELGKQLDSLADMISFGLAPASIMYIMYCGSMGNPQFAPLVFVLTAFSALRLAKFNIDDSQQTEFEGLPTPAAALFVASGGYLFANGTFTINPYYVLGMGFCLSVLLISKTRMFALKFKNFSLKDNALRYSFLTLSLVALILLQISAIPFIIMVYILISVINSFIHKRP